MTADALPGETLTGKITTINPEVDAPPATSASRRLLANPDESCVPACSPTSPWSCRKTRRCWPSRPRPCSMPPTATRSSSSRKRRTRRRQDRRMVAAPAVRPAGRKARRLHRRTIGPQGRRNVVSTGVFKLRNGQAVVVDNSLEPNSSWRPSPETDKPPRRITNLT